MMDDPYEEWLEALWCPVSNLSAHFFQDQSEALRDILTPYLDAATLAGLASVCRTFCEWVEFAGKPTLGLARSSRSVPDLEMPPSFPQAPPVWQPHGLLDDEPAMATCRAIRMHPRVFRTYLNSNGDLVERDLLPGGCINFFDTTISADLVFHMENRIHSRLYHAPYWKKLQLHLPVNEWEKPQPVRFQIREALSNRYTPPAQFRVRLTLRTYRCGSDTPTCYTWDSPEFWVVDPKTLRKSRGAMGTRHARRA